MPPVQPSLRGSLLTGVSAIALSVSGSGAQSQSTSLGLPPTLTVWGEGALFKSGGSPFNVPSLPGLGAPYTSFSPRSGLEGAVGFDYRWPVQSWHFIFDFRYGKAKTARRGSSSSSSSTFSSFVPYYAYLATNVTNQRNANSSVATERESHLVADFMIGRDLGIGAAKPQLQFGIRIADLRASAQAQQNTLTSSTSTTFYSSGVGPRVVAGPTTTTTATSAFASWKSRFFGVGPRVAIAGGLPITGAWSFDYAGGIAGLIGNRTFDAAVSTSTGNSFLGYGNSTFVFNVDAMAAVSYALATNYKVSGGFRADYYRAALTTYSVNTGALQNMNRLFSGPFVRLTGAF
jgi:hypothetical protein